MPEPTTKQPKAEGARIDVNDPCDLADWTQKLGHSADQIRHAVATVGSLAKDVHTQLSDRK